MAVEIATKMEILGVFIVAMAALCAWGDL